MPRSATVCKSKHWDVMLILICFCKKEVLVRGKIGRANNRGRKTSCHYLEHILLLESVKIVQAAAQLS